MGKIIDITGNRYGMLTVLGFSHLDNQNGAMWNVRCDCGIETTKRGYAMKKGASLSCGKHSPNKKPKGVAAANDLYRRYRQDAKNKNRSFEIDKDYFLELTQQNCHYCGSAPNKQTCYKQEYNGQYIYNGIDRIDSSKGYIVGNVVPCCHWCNIMKLNHSAEEFISHCRKVSEFNQDFT